MSPCPDCGCQYIGLDVIYAEGACRFCQQCGARPERVEVRFDTTHEDRLSQIEQVWNDWARSRAPMMANDELRYSA
jgi:hypothetical protein